MVPDPGNDLRPEVRTRVTPDQGREVLQYHAHFPRILDNTHVGYRQGIHTGLYGGQRGDFVGHVHNRERGHGKVRGPASLDSYITLA
jgi:hypothetical protein